MKRTTEANEATANPNRENLNQIKDIARDQLHKIQLLQGKGQTAILRRVNQALSESLDRAGELVEMIHHFRSISALRGEERLKITETRLQELADHVLRAMQYTYPLSKITVLKMIPKDLPAVPVPREHLETILFNLLHFARHEINGNVGIITLEASIRPEPDGLAAHDIRISYASPEMPTGDGASLFDPFYERPEKDKSVRFGLFVAKKLVEHHGGSLQIRPSLKSTLFRLEFHSAAQG